MTSIILIYFGFAGSNKLLFFVTNFWHRSSGFLFPMSLKPCHNYGHAVEFPYLNLLRVVTNHRNTWATTEGSSPSSCEDSTFRNFPHSVVIFHVRTEKYKERLFFFPTEVSTMRRLVGFETPCGSADSAYQPPHRDFYEATEKGTNCVFPSRRWWKTR